MQNIAHDDQFHRHKSKSPSNKNSNVLNFQRFIKNIDIYTKIHDDFKVRTKGGATFLGELTTVVYPKYKEHMVVDTTLGQLLRININMTFHSLTCAEVHVDAMDIAGDNQLDIEHDMLKERIDSNGRRILADAIPAKINKDFQENNKLLCLSCYGAESETISCCNTCKDLKRAYEEKGWAISEIIRNSTQCLEDPTNAFSIYKRGEGCRVSGKMNVNKVAGNFHIAHGESIVRDGRHIHQFLPAEAPGFNVSHTIHSLSFGEPYPKMPSNPLDNTIEVVQDATGLYQYYMKIIPTIFTTEWGGKVHSNQYTVTKRFRPFVMPDTSPGSQQLPSVLPGIFFVYELSPFKVEVSSDRNSFLHIFTKLLAIIGGVFSVLSVIDGILFKLEKLFIKKNSA